ncbi:alpha/beta hydrolase [Lacticaseibacillus porcinae]|uniref:alpha/beta hydrolase n=1 Tax=Lacticaseibacillus porcinae TaxID=1123687 RepID=UPI000F7A852B|nr:alpha/beta hydrolase [Lacticaseibacillus porcinae]
MHRRNIFIISLTVFLLGVAPTHFAHASTITQPVTLYVHGHHGTIRSMRPLMLAAQRDANATPALIATVKPDGEVSYLGRLTARMHHPMVQVVFDDKRTVDFHRLRMYLHNVVFGLKARYHVRAVNFVAHSLGNTAVEWYLLRWGQDPKLPHVKKWAAIAGPFDSIPRMHMQPMHNHLDPDGQPHLMAPDYRMAMLRRDQFPRLAVLNIYGDLEDGSHSDGKILNASSRALGYLLTNHSGSYQELRFTGPDAQHTKLRDNPRVAAAVDNFLWP